MQAGAKARSANIYPSYDVLRLAKQESYPSGILVTDLSAEVPLQSLVDHTVTRIIAAHPELFQNVSTNGNLEKVVASYKWGCDGSSGHSTYRQTYRDPEKNMIDEHMFTVCIVPLQVQFGSNIIWKNPRPSSTRFCRPIKISCQKETSSVVNTEVENVETQISNIRPTSVGTFQVHHQFYMTMIDEKVFSTIVETSSQTCGICKATPKMMNDLHVIQNLPLNEKFFKYGLFTLHAWIRCFECIIHISYRLPIKKWQIRGSDKVIVEKRKVDIQTELRKKMALLVDIPMAGCGNTNNGNTARRFFQQPNLAAQVTGVSEEIIMRFSVVLRAMACGYDVNPDAFRQYAFETAQKFVNEYPWFYMPSSIHKILIHGAEIIENVVLPIGMMSEEALEARNKDVRNLRLHHTRKTSRLHTMEDLLHALLFSSDPFISSLSKSTSRSSKKNIMLDKEVKNLLSCTEMQPIGSYIDSSDSE